VPGGNADDGKQGGAALSLEAYSVPSLDMSADSPPHATGFASYHRPGETRRSSDPVDCHAHFLLWLYARITSYKAPRSDPGLDGALVFQVNQKQEDTGT
jgi:hypothetical protein